LDYVHISTEYVRFKGIAACMITMTGLSWMVMAYYSWANARYSIERVYLYNVHEISHF